MNFDSIKLKEFLHKELGNTFNDNEISLYGISFCETLDLFFEVLDEKIDDKDLAGTSKTILTSIDNYAEGGINADSILELSIGLEPFLKLVTKLARPTKYDELTNRKRKGQHSSLLHMLFHYLNLKKSDGNIFYVNDPSDPVKRFPGRPDPIKKTADDLRGESFFEEHVCRAYLTRNLEGHQLPDWTIQEKVERMNSCLVVYLYSVFEYHRQLKRAITLPHFKEHLEYIKNNFVEWESLYVDISGIEDEYEDFGHIDIEAIEIDVDEEEGPDDDADIEEIRQGTIRELRNDINQMVILGPPGIGKTTSMKYLAYLDSKKILDQPKCDIKYPIFIELKYYDENRSIEEMILEQLACSKERLHQYLSEGAITLYIDGLNEILSMAASKNARILISNLIKKYPDIDLIITSRPGEYHNDLEIPVFDLQPMKDDTILSFMTKYLGDKDKAEDLFELLKTQNRLFQMVKNPLFLRMLIKVVEYQKGKLPENRGQLLRKFFQWLFSREKKFNTGFDESTFKIFMYFLAYETRKNEMVGFTESTLLNILSEKAEVCKTNTDTLDILKQAIGLNILQKASDNRLSFSHEMYQEYFCAEELLAIHEMDDTIIESLQNNTDWEEPLILFMGLSNKNEELVLSIADDNPYLATKCIQSSINRNDELIDDIIAKAIDKLNFGKDNLKYEGLDEKEIHISCTDSIVGKTFINTLSTIIDLEKFNQLSFAVKSLIIPIEYHYNNKLHYTLKESYQELIKKYQNDKIIKIFIEIEKSGYFPKNIFKNNGKYRVMRRRTRKRLIDYLIRRIRRTTFSTEGYLDPVEGKEYSLTLSKYLYDKVGKSPKNIYFLSLFRILLLPKTNISLNDLKSCGIDLTYIIEGMFLHRGAGYSTINGKMVRSMFKIIKVYGLIKDDRFTKMVNDIYKYYKLENKKKAANFNMKKTDQHFFNMQPNSVFHTLFFNLLKNEKLTALVFFKGDSNVKKSMIGRLKIVENDIEKIVDGIIQKVYKSFALVQLESKILFSGSAIHPYGTIHISEISGHFIEDINKYLKIGDKVKTKVIGYNYLHSSYQLSLKDIK